MQQNSLRSGEEFAHADGKLSVWCHSPINSWHRSKILKDRDQIFRDQSHGAPSGKYAAPCSPAQNIALTVSYFCLLLFVEKVQGNGFASMVNGRILYEANHADLRQSGTSPANRVPMVGDLLSGPIFSN